MRSTFGRGVSVLRERLIDLLESMECRETGVPRRPECGHCASRSSHGLKAPARGFERG